MVVFTVAGEVSLPGGKAEEHDKDDGITATREAEEEIGLDPSLVDVVAFLEPFLSQVSKSAHCPPLCHFKRNACSYQDLGAVFCEDTELYLIVSLGSIPNCFCNIPSFF